MAEDQNAPNLDVEQILQTLANLSKNETAPSGLQEQPYDPIQGQMRTELRPVSQYPLQASTHYSHDQSQDPRLTNHTLSRPPTFPQNRSSTPLIDPATITEWKHGLRCINKIAAQNPTFVASIQKQMADQARNIKDWETGRQRLIDDQKVKRETEKTHRAALSLPGLLDNTAPLRTPEREQEELDQFDMKVYRASRLMVESQSALLKRLGVPFFGVKPELMLPDGAEISEETQADKGVTKKITKKQLLVLQRKMLIHLMELYGD